MYEDYESPTNPHTVAKAVRVENPLSVSLHVEVVCEDGNYVVDVGPRLVSEETLHLAPTSLYDDYYTSTCQITRWSSVP